MDIYDIDARFINLDELRKHPMLGQAEKVVVDYDLRQRLGDLAQKVFSQPELPMELVEKLCEMHPSNSVLGKLDEHRQGQ